MEWYVRYFSAIGKGAVAGAQDDNLACAFQKIVFFVKHGAAPPVLSFLASENLFPRGAG
jgi:hypothetical protein